MNPPTQTRALQEVIQSIVTSDGAGVRLRRSLGQRPDARLDPFLMLDEFSSENPDDYLAGFPSHPHRGIETVTYMLDGHMRHEDHLGHRGDLKSGAVQWMTAGRGIIHSEMPLQEDGRLRGFQLWINLPAKEKMKGASYRDIQPYEIPVLDMPNGTRIKVIAGTLAINGQTATGPVQGLSTTPLFLDVALPAGHTLTHPLDKARNAFAYPYEGAVEIGPPGAVQRLDTHAAGVLTPGDEVTISAAGQDARYLLLAGRPLGEPVVQYGPFVMNTREEIEQAIRDYQNGELTEPAA